MRRFLYIFILLIAGIGTIAAQTSFTVIPPRQVIAGNKFSVTFRVANGDGSSLKVPEIDGCTLLYGPSTSTMQSYQFVNGQQTSSRSTDYSYIYRADKAGTFTIGEASVVIDGKRYTTRPVSFKVLPADKSQQGAGNQPGVRVDDYSTQTSDRSVSANDVFVRIILSRSKVYEQEAVECTIKLYTKYQISSFMATTQPSFDGFLIQELNLQPSLNEIEHYNGQNYMTAILKKCIIFPQKSGKLTINSGKYDITVVQHERMGGFFGGSRPVERQIKVSSNSASVNVDALPQPQPDGFSGAVGQFSISSELRGDSFRTNEASSLVYTIKGTGNIKYLKEPVIDFPSEFEQYTPKSDIQASVSGNTVTGTMTVEYTFIPQSVGDFTIGSDKFVYFNPATRQYVTLTTPTYDIKVAKGVGTTTATSVDNQSVTAKNTDIRHIKTGDKKHSMHHQLVVNTAWYWILYAVLLLLLILAVYIYGRKVRAAADLRGTRLARANKVARRRLKVARKFMDSHQSDKFYEEMLRATWGYLSDKLDIPASQLSRENISSVLESYGAPAQLTDKFISVLDDCEMSRYTPMGSDEDMSVIYTRASEAMDSMASLKRAKTNSMKTIIAIVAVASALSLNATPLTEQADSAYMHDDFTQAAQLYSTAIATEGTSSVLLYNLGNAQYRLGQLGEAIVSYEQALRLDPTNEDARVNLEFVNSRITDKPIDSGTFISNTTDRVLDLATPNTWAWLAFASFALLLGCGALYIFASNVAARKSGFFIGLVLIAVTIILVILALNAAHRAEAHDSAVVTVPSTILSTSPRAPKDRSEEAILLHEGTKVEITDSVTSRVDSVSVKWYEVKLDNTNRAWVNAGAVKKI
ncbi:MAG: BatD family protein [Pseudoflavonifractor sp.]|nr:BatD family protein [Pseudoflavonifractor sp.]